MSFQQVFLYNAGALVLVGIFGILTRRNIIKILLSINILQTGVNLLIVALGYKEGGEAPIITEQLSRPVLFVDPLPQALVLTAIVIAFGTTALGLAIAVNYFRTHKSLETSSFMYGGVKPDEEEVVE